VVVAKERVSVRCPKRVRAVLPVYRTRLLPNATTYAEAVFARLPEVGRWEPSPLDWRDADDVALNRSIAHVLRVVEERSG
jgi:hypothetical protein